MTKDKDLVNLYLKDIREYKLLTKEEEEELIKKAKSGDEEAKKSLTLSNLRLVVKMAKNYLNKGLSFIDLISEGNIGLIKAIDKFDQEKGFRFSTYAVWWIKQAISKAVINKGREIRIPSYKYDLLNKINAAISSSIIEKSSYPTIAEISKKIGLTEKQVESVLVEFQDLISLSTPIGDEIVLEDVVEQDGLTLEDEVLTAIIKEDINKTLETLKEREREILILRYGLNDEAPKTLEEVGNLFDITRERVRQIEKKALSKLRDQFKDTLKEYLY